MYDWSGQGLLIGCRTRDDVRYMPRPQSHIFVHYEISDDVYIHQQERTHTLGIKTLSKRYNKLSGTQDIKGWCSLPDPTPVSIQKATHRFVAWFTAITWYEYVIRGLVKARTQEDTIYLYSDRPRFPKV